jgi:hypothetical protein
MVLIPAVAVIHQMTNRPRILQTKLSRHDRRMPRAIRHVPRTRTDGSLNLVPRARAADGDATGKKAF